jgi:hypothetical protein
MLNRLLSIMYQSGSEITGRKVDVMFGSIFHNLSLEVVGIVSAAQNDGIAAALSGILLIVYLAIIVLWIACYWKLFDKAGEPGWAAIIPIYNYIVLLKIIRRPWWWILLLWTVIIPIMMMIDLAKAFGKGTGFAIGLIFLPIIFIPILAFGDSQYQLTPSSGGLPLL